ICMVLLASVPFVFLHAAHGWIEARSKSIRLFVESERQREAWDIANQLHMERSARAQKHADDQWAAEKEAWDTQRRAAYEDWTAAREAAREAAMAYIPTVPSPLAIPNQEAEHAAMLPPAETESMQIEPGANAEQS